MYRIVTVPPGDPADRSLSKLNLTRLRVLVFVCVDLGAGHLRGPDRSDVPSARSARLKGDLGRATCRDY
jgi:hypothetical protein